MKRARADWHFAYEPIATRGGDRGAAGLDVVVALGTHVDGAALVAALRGLDEVTVAPLLDHAPLHWVRVQTAAPASRLDVAGLLARGGVPVRYVAAAGRADLALPPRLAVRACPPARPLEWPARETSTKGEPATAGGRWFLGSRGVNVERAICGTGAGTRLAVVDDDAADVEHLDLDRVVPVGVERLAAASGHAALMLGWAVGARWSDGDRFVGVAPDASARLYCIPKAGADVVSLPVAIARAVLDGADVVLCATYVEGTTSPMLDDALEIAQHLGRRGRGAIVVFPTGRETSSPARSVHASLTLSLADPASDPRVHCVAPGGRDGGWFLWKDARGRLRPFANRGPAVRWLSPGDDLAYPLAPREALYHAESSGAAAIAAGVALLVLGCNARLHAHEVHALLERTARPPEPMRVPDSALADPADVLPLGRDLDGHDAKCGYGGLHATRACLGARDPFALALTAMGEDDAARTWCLRAARHYSPELGRWAAAVLLARPDLEHAAKVLLRHLRLRRPEERMPRRRPSGSWRCSSARARTLAERRVSCSRRSSGRRSGCGRRSIPTMPSRRRWRTKRPPCSESIR